jgi:sarcosine oxidase
VRRGALDAIVIGGGIAGTGCARALAQRGATTTLLEQFEFGHTRGSSHGPTRLFRIAYPEPDYVRLAVRAVASWRALEDAAGEALLVTTGGLYSGEWADDCTVALEACGVRHEWLSPEEAAERFPMLSFEGLPRVLWQEDGGVCLADRTVAAQARVAREAGVDVREGEAALRLSIEEDGVSVETESETLRARVAVVTAGSWAGPLLAQVGIDLPATPKFAQVSYFAPAGDTGVPSPPGYIEAVRWRSGLALGGYFVPSPPELGADVREVKGGDAVPGRVIDPSEGPLQVDEAKAQRVAELVRLRLPGFDPSPVRNETCKYTMTEDDDFVLDRVGPVVVGSACSGHGFKFGPLLGELLAGLVLGSPDEAPWERFALERAMMRR